MVTKTPLISLFIASQSLCSVAAIFPSHLKLSRALKSLNAAKWMHASRPDRLDSHLHRRRRQRQPRNRCCLICGGRPLTRPRPRSMRPPSCLSMSLIPAPVDELRNILPTPSRLSPNGDQYVAYFGRTPMQRYNSLFEGVGIAFLGSMFAYFVSFVIGQFLATLLGVVFLFWPMLSPEFKAYQRNWELVGGRDLVDVWMRDSDDNRYPSGVPGEGGGLYGAYYTSRILEASVVDDVRASADEEYELEEFGGYTMATDELEGVTGLPWKLRLRLSDGEGRGMQVHSRMSEEYLDIRPGMNAVGVLLSAGREFGELAGMTDFCILNEVDGEAIAWVGDYPYLDKDSFLRTLNENGVTDSLLDFEQEEEEELYDSGEEEEAEEYINIR